MVDIGEKLRDWAPTYEAYYLIWSMTFIDEYRVALGRNNATVDIYDLQNESFEVVNIPATGICVQVVLSSPENYLWVNVWKGYRKKDEQEVYKIDLSTLAISKAFNGKYLLSTNHQDMFLLEISKAMRMYWLTKGGGSCGVVSSAYGVFNHYFQTLDSINLYYIAGSKKQHFKDKKIFSISPGQTKPKPIYLLDAKSSHLNSIRGAAFQEGLICAAVVYESRQYAAGSALVFRIENEDLKWKWKGSLMIACSKSRCFSSTY